MTMELTPKMIGERIYFVQFSIARELLQVNIAIVRTFVKLREMLESNKDLAKKIDQLERKFLQHDHQFKAVFEAIRQLMAVGPPLPQKRIKDLSNE